MKKATGIIYCLQNKVNLKQYVGQTIVPLNSRLSKHFSDSLRIKKNTAIGSAIRKYGKENFIIFELEICEIAHLNEREAHWIYFLDTYKQGYNRQHRSNHDRQEIDKIIKEFLKGATQDSLAKKHHICKKTLRYHLIKQGIDPRLNIRKKSVIIRINKTSRTTKTNRKKLSENTYKIYYNDFDINGIIDMYNDGCSSRKISEKFGYDRATIIKILRESNIEIRGNHRKNMNYIIRNEKPELIPNIIKLYSDGNNLKQISSIIKLNPRHISKILKQNNIEVKSGGSYNAK